MLVWQTSNSILFQQIFSFHVIANLSSMGSEHKNVSSYLWPFLLSTDYVKYLNWSTFLGWKCQFIHTSMTKSGIWRPLLFHSGGCSVAQLCLTLCNAMDSSPPASVSFIISLSFLKLTSIESVMPSNHLSSVAPFSSCPHPSQHQGLFQCVSSLHQVDKVLELQHQSF